MGLQLTCRPINESDVPILQESLLKDQFHTETDPSFFFAPGTACNLYEDEKGPVLFLRGTKSLRIDIQFIDNDDTERNAEALLSGFDAVVERAKQNGFSEIVFCTTSRGLKAFCKRRFHFREVEGELRRPL